MIFSSCVIVKMTSSYFAELGSMKTRVSDAGLERVNVSVSWFYLILVTSYGGFVRRLAIHIFHHGDRNAPFDSMSYWRTEG